MLLLMLTCLAQVSRKFLCMHTDIRWTQWALALTPDAAAAIVALVDCRPCCFYRLQEWHAAWYAWPCILALP